MPTEPRPQDTTPPPTLPEETTQVLPRWGEPAPIMQNSGPVMHDLVAADIQSRSDFGLSKYGTRLRAFNGRDPLKDAYEEVLDLAVYLRQLMYERDKREEWMDTNKKLSPAVRGESSVVAYMNTVDVTKQLSLFDDPDKTLKIDRIA